MLRARSEDRNRIVEILLQAFEHNKSVNYICGNGSNRYQRIRLLIEYAFNVCNKYGKVFISGDRNACALVLFPDKKSTSIRSLAWDSELALKVIGLNNIFKIFKRETQIKKHHPLAPFYYLWFIGVQPSRHGIGIGSSLLREILDDAAQMNRPIYLETSTVENLIWYKRFGFKIYGEMDFGYKFFLLKTNATNE
ncbi:MAG: GNAT family N-acetyltransferase [Bacteroidota bacterium]